MSLHWYWGVIVPFTVLALAALATHVIEKRAIKMAKMKPEDQEALDNSLRDAQRCARRLTRLMDDTAHRAALVFIRKLIELGAHQEE